MAIQQTNEPYKQAQDEFLAIKCALRGHIKVKEKEECENEQTWVLPPLNDRLKPELDDQESKNQSTYTKKNKK